MRQKRKQTHEINTGTFADISFLLLIFFMVVTTFHKSYQLEMNLPPKKDAVIPGKISKERVLRIYLNDTDEVLVEDEIVAAEDINIIDELRRITAHTKPGLIKIQMTPDTKYQSYINLLAHINQNKKEFRGILANEMFQRDYTYLTKDEKRKISARITYSISETELSL